MRGQEAAELYIDSALLELFEKLDEETHDDPAQGLFTEAEVAEALRAREPDLTEAYEDYKDNDR